VLSRTTRSQNFHSDQSSIIRLSLLPHVISHFLDDALAGSSGRSVSQPVESVEKSTVSKILPIFVGCLRDTVAENESQ
jgi:hypothetical protein